ncbi:hypothetical protein EI94DRAFT_1745593 [Lactarius quietus]|nr:hypothetical protein EI94DRAFT_1745593 [Lactarius quietus]
MAHYDIFRENLVIKYPAYGHALWEPSTGGRYPAVAVGDVGFIREGQFHRLFNVLLSPNDPSHRLGVPEENEQLRPRVDDHIITGTLAPHNFCSSGVALESEPGIFANEPNSPGVSFSCRGKQGAVLSLPMQARCQNTVALGDFGEWMIKHIDRWIAWARQLGMGINRMEDIVLVTGAHLTRSWTNVAFLGDQTDARVSFEFQVAPDTSINWHAPPDRIIGAVLNPGPIGMDLPEDQCIFIRGFRVTRKLKILPRMLKGAAGPNQDPKGSGCEPDSEVELIPISSVPEFRDPLHILLEYIAESVPGCDMVLVHDDDLARLDGFSDDTSLQPVAVAAHLRRSKPEIREVLFHLDLSSGSENANADTETVKAAMLSGSHIFEERPPLPLPTTSRPLAGLISFDHTPPGLPETSSTSSHLHSHSKFMPNDVFSWTSQDPRQSLLFTEWGVVYRFQTDTNEQGQSTTILWRTIGPNKENQVAKLQWAPGGGLGRAVIGKNTYPMADLIRQDPQMPNSRVFNGPDGLQYRWRPSTTSQDIVLQDPNNHVVAFIRHIRPRRYQEHGEVYAELHFIRSAGAGVVMHPPLMDMVTVTAMLLRCASG